MPNTAGLHVGVNEILYRNTGSYSSPTWTPIPIVKDVTITLGKSKAEIKARLATWKMTMPGIKELGLEFDILGDKSNANWTALRDAYINDTVLDLAVADQAIANSGCEYLRSDFYLYGFPIDQKMEAEETAKVSADVAYHATHLPSFTNVA